MIDIYVINLNSRKDRFIKIVDLFKNYNNITLHRVEGVEHKNGIIGCFLSHKKCIKYAKDNNMKNIVVIEDDCLPLGDYFEDRLINIKSYLDNINDLDIFIGGGFNIVGCYHIKYKLDTNLHNLYMSNSGFCMHLIIYNQRSYDFFLDFDENKNIPIDNI